MPANSDRKFRIFVDRVDDLIGADIPRDVLKIALAAQDVSVLDQNLEQVAGTAQTAADWTTVLQNTRDAVELLDDSVQSNAADELRARVFGPDAGGDLQQVVAEQFDTALATTDVGLATYSDRALQSVAQDELRSRMHDSSGTQIDPATTALENALQANAADEFRVRAFGLDAGGVLQAVNAEQFDTALATTDVGLATYSARALRTLAQDHFQTVIFGEGAGGTLQEVGVEAFDSAAAAGGFALLTYGDRALQTQAQDEFRSRLFGLDAGGAIQQVNAEQFSVALASTDVGVATYGDRALQTLAQDELRSRVHDSSGTQIDPLNQDALQTVGGDELRARLFQPDAGGVLQQVIAEALDTAAAATDVGLLTWSARALNSVGQDEWVARTADSAGAQQDLQQTDSAFHNGTAIAAGGTDTTGLSAPGASKLRGRVVNDAQYDVDIEVLDAPGGTVLFTVNVATDVAADTETTLDENLESPFINVVVTNDGGAESSMTAAYHLVGGN